MTFEAKDLTILHDRVALEIEQEEEKTTGGIYIPEAAKEKSNVGKVVAIGDEVEDVAVGDKVLFSKYAGAEYKLDRTTLKIMSERDIIAVITAEE